MACTWHAVLGIGLPFPAALVNAQTLELGVKGLNTAASVDSVCLLDGAEVVYLMRDSGSVRWRAGPPAKGSERTAGTLIIHEGVVIYAERGFPP